MREEREKEGVKSGGRIMRNGHYVRGRVVRRGKRKVIEGNIKVAAVLKC